MSDKMLALVHRLRHREPCYPDRPMEIEAADAIESLLRSKAGLVNQRDGLDKDWREAMDDAVAALKDVEALRSKVSAYEEMFRRGAIPAHIVREALGDPTKSVSAGDTGNG